MEIKAILKKINSTVSRNGFDSRKIWLTIPGDYPQTIEVEASGKNLNVFDNIPIGAGVTCQIDLRGREWTNPKGEVIVFNTISVWKAEATGKTVNNAQPQQQKAK